MHDTGVIAYRSISKAIEVQFRDESRYLYTEASAGAARIKAMKKYAEQGTGLTTYINQHVRENYAARLD